MEINCHFGLRVTVTENKHCRQIKQSHKKFHAALRWKKKLHLMSFSSRRTQLIQSFPALFNCMLIVLIVVCLTVDDICDTGNMTHVSIETALLVVCREPNNGIYCFSI